MFTPGQKVLKVPQDGSHPHRTATDKPSGLPILTNYSVYTVREVDARVVGATSIHGNKITYPTVRLVGIHGAVENWSFGPMECGYCACIFRPLSEDYLRRFEELRKPLDHETEEEDAS